MNKVTLFVGAAVLVVLGLTTKEPSEVSAGLALMWIGLSVK